MPDLLAAGVAGTCAGCARLEARIAALEQRLMPRLSSGDCDRLRRVLPVTGGLLGSTAFKVCELFAHPSPALALALSGCSSKALGRLLGRAVKAGAVVDGYVVEQAGVEGGVALWAVAKVIS